MSYFYQNKIPVISVSDFHKKNINIILPNIVVFPIYNSLFPEYLIKNENIKYDRNTMIFCSNWAKGLGRVLRIGREYYKHNPNSSQQSEQVFVFLRTKHDAYQFKSLGGKK